MAALYELQKHFVAPSNIEFLGFVSEQAVPIALKGEIPDLTRRFTLQTAKSLVNQSATRADFDKLIIVVKSQNDEIKKKVEAAVGESVEKINEGFTEQYDIDLAMSVSQIIPLPVHVETDRSLAYSAFIKYSMNDAAGNPAPFVVAMTLTFIHVKGKILFLYSYADESGLEWSRSTSKQWAGALIESNPSDFQSSINELLPAAVTAIDWRQAGEMALLGAFIGCLIGLAGWLVKRRKAS